VVKITEEHKTDEHKSNHEEHHTKEEHKPHHAEHHSKKSDEGELMEISKLTLWKAATTVLAILLVFSIYTGGFGTGSSDSNTGTGTQQAVVAQPRDSGQAAPSPSLDMVELADDDSIKGDPNAPVTIVEWSDFECPFCTRFYEQTLGQIDEQYIKTGKVKMYYRDFPLGFHSNAQKAAEAAECAGDQGKFWEMHDALFDNGVSGGISSFKKFAGDLGLNTADFNDCLDSGKFADEVKQDMADGTAVGIRGTPGFIINGQLVSGAQPFSVFQEIIEAELAK